MVNGLMPEVIIKSRNVAPSTGGWPTWRTRAERQTLRQFYVAMRGGQEHEAELFRYNHEELDELQSRFEAECAALVRLDAEIAAVWPECDPDDIFPTALDQMLDLRSRCPARIAVHNPSVRAIGAARAQQLAHQEEEARKQFAERSMDYTPRERPGLRAHYDPFAALFRLGWGSSVWD